MRRRRILRGWRGEARESGGEREDEGVKVKVKTLGKRRRENEPGTSLGFVPGPGAQRPGPGGPQGAAEPLAARRPGAPTGWLAVAPVAPVAPGVAPGVGLQAWRRWLRRGRA